ncbi:PREDICTED: defensin-like protein 183 [Camelina sativa]|uniref:Defensin-like protein n=1 Tax=Camelina sativa TaxID=90675 RepID=A0ABM0X2C6_CAMSA|nr:PREDICTED: defensin-like protein 183 [Camelina sativa]
MEKTFSVLLVFIIFFIIFASVENKMQANACMEGLGNCQQCDARCKAKYGPEGKGSCDVRNQLCTCYYPCGKGPSSLGPLQSNTCNAVLPVCDDKCDSECCNQICAQNYLLGSGLCDSNGGIYMCKCQYSC